MTIKNTNALLVLLMALLISASLTLSGCGAETEEQALMTDEIIIENGLSIINEYENVPVKFFGFKQLDDGIVPEEIIDKKLYYYEQDIDVSPREYYYDNKNENVYLLKEGMWFIINQDYKNVTPEDSGMYDIAEEAREQFKAESKKP